MISVQKFSMGLRSGEFPGHLSTLTRCGGVFLAKAEVVFTSCHKEKQGIPHGIYISVLDGHSLNFTNIHRCTTFQQDSAPCHKAKSVTNCFQTKNAKCSNGQEILLKFMDTDQKESFYIKFDNFG